MNWDARQMPDQTGVTALVTGSNTGIGLATAEALAERGARVLVAARDKTKADAAIESVSRKATGPAPEHISLDLSDLAAVRDAATSVARTTDKLDILINNAAVMMPARAETGDGFEIHFGTNHLGHFAFTGLLMETLHRAPAPRVVTVGSFMSRYPGTRIRWEDLHWERGRYRWQNAYGQSKKANLLGAVELDRLARQHNSPLRSVAAHPGGAYSGLMRNTGVVQSLSKWLLRPVMQSSEHGARPSLQAATDPSVPGGAYLGPDGFLGCTGRSHAINFKPDERDPEAASRIWAICEQLTGVTYSWGSAALSPTDIRDGT